MRYIYTNYFHNSWVGIFLQFMQLAAQENVFTQVKRIKSIVTTSPEFYVYMTYDLAVFHICYVHLHGIVTLHHWGSLMIHCLSLRLWYDDSRSWYSASCPVDLVRSSAKRFWLPMRSMLLIFLSKCLFSLTYFKHNSFLPCEFPQVWCQTNFLST